MELERLARGLAGRGLSRNLVLQQEGNSSQTALLARHFPSSPIQRIAPLYRGPRTVAAPSEEMPMCLGVPGRVIQTYREHDVLMGKVDFGGVIKRACLE